MGKWCLQYLCGDLSRSNLVTVDLVATEEEEAHKEAVTQWPQKNEQRTEWRKLNKRREDEWPPQFAPQLIYVSDKPICTE